MNIRFAVTLLILVVVTSFGLRSFGDEDSGKASFLEELKNLESLTYEEREKWLSNTSTSLRDLQSAVIKELKRSQSDDARACLAFLLGRYRSVEAAEPLSKMIGLKNPSYDRFPGLPLVGAYPAYDALVRIGTPSLRFMVKNLESSDDKTERDLSAQVIWRVLGTAFDNTTRGKKGKELARLFLCKAIEWQSDPAKKKNLESALKYFDTGTHKDSQSTNEQRAEAAESHSQSVKVPKPETMQTSVPEIAGSRAKPVEEPGESSRDLLVVVLSVSVVVLAGVVVFLLLRRKSSLR
jgi:hypothetical protein